jgi:tetratricopeptide (TPR) repeat protein
MVITEVRHAVFSGAPFGDVQVAQGNLPEALKSYKDSLAIRDRLAKSDPGNMDWQRDLSISYGRVGGVQEAQGDLSEALKTFRDGLAIRDRLAKSDPGDSGLQRDLSASLPSSPMCISNRATGQRRAIICAKARRSWRS